MLKQHTNIHPRLADGLILVDILTALALATMFVALITRSTIETYDMFVFADERNKLLNIYEIHQDEFADLVPYESRLIMVPPTNQGDGTTTITASARWYGNERIETSIKVFRDGYTKLYSPFASFTAIHGSSEVLDGDVSGTSLCTAEFMEKQDIKPTIKPIVLPIDRALSLTDIEVRNGVAYISVDSTIASDPDLFILNIRDADHPIVLSSINTGPGISSITLAGARVYAAAASSAAQLHIIRLLSLDTPILEKKYQLPLPQASTSPPYGISIAYDRGKVYLGTEKWDGEEFTIIDISLIANPTKIGGLEIGNQVQDIAINQNNAYIVGPGHNQLRRIDISDLNNPALQNSFSSSGWERQEGNVVTIFEDALNIGRTSGGFNIVADHEVFSWATTSKISLSDYISLDRKGGIYGLVIDRSHVYFVSRDINREFQIFNRDLSTTTATFYSLPAIPGRLVCDNSSLYLLAHEAPVIYQIIFKK